MNGKIGIVIILISIFIVKITNDSFGSLRINTTSDIIKISHKLCVKEQKLKPVLATEESYTEAQDLQVEELFNLCPSVFVINNINWTMMPAILNYNMNQQVHLKVYTHYLSTFDPPPQYQNVS